MTSSNRQKFVIMVQSKQGSAWAVATPTQRGFTKIGAESALISISEAIPNNWKCWIEEVTPIDFLLESIFHLRKS